MLEESGLKIASVLSLDGSHEADVLRLAAIAFRGLADVRAKAMQVACQVNGIAVEAVRASFRGPGITFRDGTRGICVRDARGLDSPSEIACPLEVVADGRAAGMVIFGPSPGPHAAQAIKELLVCGGLAVGLLSHRPTAELESLATSLGVDVREGGLSSELKVKLLQSFRRRGRKVAYIGDCAAEPEVAREAHVAISLAGGSDPERNCASASATNRPGVDRPLARAFARACRPRAHCPRRDSLAQPRLHCGSVLFGVHELVFRRADKPGHAGNLLGAVAGTKELGTSIDQSWMSRRTLNDQSRSSLDSFIFADHNACYERHRCEASADSGPRSQPARRPRSAHRAKSLFGNGA